MFPLPKTADFFVEDYHFRRLEPADFRPPLASRYLLRHPRCRHWMTSRFHKTYLAELFGRLLGEYLREWRKRLWLERKSLEIFSFGSSQSPAKKTSVLDDVFDLFLALHPTMYFANHLIEYLAVTAW